MLASDFDTMPLDKCRGRKEREGAQSFFLSFFAALRVLCVKIFSLKRLSFQNQLEAKRPDDPMPE